MSSSTDPRPAAVREALAAEWLCTLATSSGESRPHVAGVLHALVDRDLYYGVGVSEAEMAADPLSAFASVAW